jgi:predicted GIY-YIG superfamily endonuclease
VRRRTNRPGSFFHCYCLHSLDPKHPLKTYVGFTTNPERRIRQHNGVLKHGGAWRTKRAGRPWDFVVIVHGFPTQKMALQFEWAWQHCDKSLAVRSVIGDVDSRTLKRKRGIQGQLSILKTMLLLCPDLYGRNSMTLYFFNGKYKQIYENIIVQESTGTDDNKSNESSDSVPFIALQEIQSITEMPFYPTRNATSTTTSNVSDQSQRYELSDEVFDDVNHSHSQTVEPVSSRNRNSMGSLYRRCQEDYNLLFDSSSSDDDNDDFDFDVDSLSNSSIDNLMDRSEDNSIPSHEETTTKNDNSTDWLDLEQSSPDEFSCDVDSNDDADDDLSGLTATFTTMKMPSSPSSVGPIRKRKSSTSSDASSLTPTVNVENHRKGDRIPSTFRPAIRRLQKEVILTDFESDESDSSEKVASNTARMKSTTRSQSTANPQDVIDLCSP